MTINKDLAEPVCTMPCLVAHVHTTRKLESTASTTTSFTLARSPSAQIVSQQDVSLGTVSLSCAPALPGSSCTAALLSNLFARGRTTPQPPLAVVVCDVSYLQASQADSLLFVCALHSIQVGHFRAGDHCIDELNPCRVSACASAQGRQRLGPWPPHHAIEIARQEASADIYPATYRAFPLVALAIPASLLRILSPCRNQHLRQRSWYR